MSDKDSHQLITLVGLFIVIAPLVWVVIAAHRDEKFQGTLWDLVSDKKDHLSVFQLGVITALLISSWGFVVLILSDKMTEWYFTIYMTVLVVGKLANNAISVKNDQLNPESHQ